MNIRTWPPISRAAKHGLLTGGLSPLNWRSTPASRRLADEILVRIGSGDETGTGLESRVGPQPVEEHDHPVAEADQERHVHDTPQQPGERAANGQPAEIGNGGAPADRRHGAEVAIAERAGCGLACKPGMQHAGYVGALLLGDRREPR